MMHDSLVLPHDLPHGGPVLQGIAHLRPQMQALLREAIAQPSLSGGEARFVRYIESWARDQGFEVECFDADEARLAGYRQARQPHLPLAGRPILQVRLPGHAGGPRLLFNAHSDVVPAGDERTWHTPPWSGAEVEGRIFGRGAADDKGPLVSALWAMLTLRREIPPEQRSDVLLELVPGEEDRVGLGTLASLDHGVTAEGVIVLEPTEGQPRCASRAGCRFNIQAEGRAVHGTVKWLGADAIAIMRRVLEALEMLEARWNDRNADPLFAAYPIARPITVDRIEGGHGQGMIADRCLAAGYLELLPNDAITSWMERFQGELLDELQPLLVRTGGSVTIEFGEEYEGHSTPADHPICRLAVEIMRKVECGNQETGDRSQASESGMRNTECGMRNEMQTLELTGFNSGCEAGLRARLEGMPTLVWGPGSLAQAHAADEYIAFDQVERVAAMFTWFAAAWSKSKGASIHGVNNQA